jgi:predicted kinase
MNELIVIYGLPCSGKSTVCTHLSTILNCPIVKIDDIWGQTFTNPTYTIEEGNIVFLILLKQLKRHISLKQNRIVVEGVFASVSRLLEIEKLALANSYGLKTILLFDNLESLLSKNYVRRNKGGTQLKNEALEFLANKFDSSKFCHFSIHTGKVSEDDTKHLIEILIQNGK